MNKVAEDRDLARDRSRLALTRRGLLATLAAGFATTLAGCGYQPGAGEFDWDTRVRTGPTGIPSWGPSNSRSDVVCDGSLLVSVRNQSGQTHDFETSELVEYENAAVAAFDAAGDAWSTTTERHYVGMPALNDEGVYVPLDDGSVTCLAPVSASDSDGGGPGDDETTVEPRWTTDSLLADAGDESVDGTAIHLAAADGSLLAAHSDGILGIDAETGDRRFAADLEVGSLEDDSRIAAGSGLAWVATTGEPMLYGFDFDGVERVAISLPSTPDWLETTAVPGTDDSERTLALVHAGARLWAVDSDGDRRWSLDVGRPSTRLVADDGDRLYLASSNTLTAVDLTTGDRLWERDSPFDDGTVVADARGVYGARTESSGLDSEYRLVAVTLEGDDRWDLPTHDDVDGVDDVFLLEDRLVLSDDDRLYAFRTSEGDRRSIL